MNTVLVTGAGRGIGRATALRLARAGWHVFAGVRNVKDGEALIAELGSAAGKIETVRLDITDPADVAALAGALPNELDAVVNNAGIVIDGPVESLTSDRLAEQFAVNVTGQIAVTRAVLEKIRAAHGRIVFVSSVSGRISTPWTGAYNSSKAALESIADALRLELRPWRIPVTLIEPANTQTDMWGGAVKMFDDGVATMSERERELYAGHMKGMRRALGLMHKTASSVDGVAKMVERALDARRPRARYVIGLPAKAQLFSAALTPRPLLDWVLARATGVPRKSSES